MAWCTDGNINTFSSCGFCTWLEYGSVGDCMYGYRNNGLYFPDIPVSVICIADAMVKLICGIYLLFIAKPSKYIPNMIK